MGIHVHLDGLLKARGVTAKELCKQVGITEANLPVQGHSLCHPEPDLPLSPMRRGGYSDLRRHVGGKGGRRRCFVNTENPS